MAEYIEREEAKKVLAFGVGVTAANALDQIPAACVVPKGAYEQVEWERDIAIQQLREDYGVGLGEKKSTDVVEVVHGRWEDLIPKEEKVWVWDVRLRCSECGYIYSHKQDRFAYCPSCGARMDGE